MFDYSTYALEAGKLKRKIHEHVFNCSKVENGWTFVYRNKTHIASSLDEMMELMKAAMVTERIEK